MAIVGTVVTEKPVRPYPEYQDQLPLPEAFVSKTPDYNPHCGCNEVRDERWKTHLSLTNTIVALRHLFRDPIRKRACSNESEHAANNKGKIRIADCSRGPIVERVRQNRRFC